MTTARKVDRRMCPNAQRPVGAGHRGLFPHPTVGARPDGLWFDCAECGRSMRSYDDGAGLRRFVNHHKPAEPPAGLRPGEHVNDWFADGLRAAMLRPDLERRAD